MKIFKKSSHKFLSFWKIEGEENYLTLGVKIMLSFLVIIFLWALLAPINSSIISSGEIILTSNKKIISHLEGGVIDKIKIQEILQENQEIKEKNKEMNKKIDQLM
jgi:epimerase transport system membrane fusion protein